MLKPTSCKKDMYLTMVKNLKKINQRYCLVLAPIDFSTHICIDIHDFFGETIGNGHISSSLTNRILQHMPNELFVSNYSGYWKLENGERILSEAIAKSV